MFMITTTPPTPKKKGYHKGITVAHFCILHLNDILLPKCTPKTGSVFKPHSAEHSGIDMTYCDSKMYYITTAKLSSDLCIQQWFLTNAFQWLLNVVYTVFKIIQSCCPPRRTANSHKA